MQADMWLNWKRWSWKVFYGEIMPVQPEYTWQECSVYWGSVSWPLVLPPPPVSWRENHCLFSRHVCYNWYHICTPFCILVRKILLLLFSHWVVSDSFATPWTVALEAPLFIAFPWQEYWSGLPFFSPRNLSSPGIQPASPCIGRWILYHWVTREAQPCT